MAVADYATTTSAGTQWSSNTLSTSATSGTVAWSMPPDNGFGEMTPQVRDVDELSHAVFDTPIETLVNMWIARFGHGFIHYGVIEQDTFFRLSAFRLMNLNKVEYVIIGSAWHGRVPPE